MPGARDSELLERARDASAFDMLIRRHDKHLYRIARSVLPDDAEAEDAVQEALSGHSPVCAIFAALPACGPGSRALS